MFEKCILVLDVLIKVKENRVRKPVADIVSSARIEHIFPEDKVD